VTRSLDVALTGLGGIGNGVLVVQDSFEKIATMESASSELVSLTSGIVAAYLSVNAVSPGDIPALIATVHRALAVAGEPEAAPADLPAKRTAAQIRKSITPDALISFEDGRAYKTLKRHLTTHGLTIADYKVKWGLPRDYPTTAPSYSARRSAMAKAAGLGQPGKVSAPATIAKSAAKPKAAPEAAVAATSARRGRPKKVTA
jgi:predicted transcriptional regulator